MAQSAYGYKGGGFGLLNMIHKRLLLRKILGMLQARYRVGVDKSLIVRQEQCQRRRYGTTI